MKWHIFKIQEQYNMYTQNKEILYFLRGVDAVTKTLF